jgi:hypothetical protein
MSLFKFITCELLYIKYFPQYVIKSHTRVNCRIWGTCWCTLVTHPFICSLTVVLCIESFLYVYLTYTTLWNILTGNIFGSKIDENEFLNIESWEDTEILKCSQKLKSSIQHLWDQYMKKKKKISIYWLNHVISLGHGIWVEVEKHFCP